MTQYILLAIVLGALAMSAMAIFIAVRPKNGRVNNQHRVDGSGP